MRDQLSDAAEQEQATLHRQLAATQAQLRQAERERDALQRQHLQVRVF